MSGSVADRKRLFRVTAGNLRQSHIYINGHYDFFPKDSFGPSRKSAKKTGAEIEVFLSGLNETIRTDIGANAKTDDIILIEHNCWILLSQDNNRL